MICGGTKTVIQVIGVIDTLIAFVLIGVACFQFQKGPLLLGGVLRDSEKITRLVFYATIIYFFLLVQIIMAVKLIRCAGKINEKPAHVIKVIGWWREWSGTFLVVMLLHALLVLFLMEDRQRKSICLASTLIHSAVRPIGIAVLGRFRRRLELRTSYESARTSFKVAPNPSSV